MWHGVDQLEADKNIRSKMKFLNYFLQDRFYPYVEFYGWKTTEKMI
mgnify:CR=1 FL=1